MYLIYKDQFRLAHWRIPNMQCPHFISIDIIHLFLAILLRFIGALNNFRDSLILTHYLRILFLLRNCPCTEVEKCTWIKNIPWRNLSKSNHMRQRFLRFVGSKECQNDESDRRSILCCDVSSKNTGCIHITISEKDGYVFIFSIFTFTL